MKEECQTCKFFKLDNDLVDVGDCRCNPPSMPLSYKDFEDNYDSELGYFLSCRFPIVEIDSWCGEFKNK